jgi:cytochrome c2
MRITSLIAALAVLLTASSALAATPADATAESGKKLIADAKCEACHIGKMGGDGSAMYTRKDRRVTSKSKLLAQVSRCNSELNVGLFPDDEAAIAAYLNTRHYKFKD